MVRSDDRKNLEVGGSEGSAVKDLSKIKDASEIKALVSGLPFSVPWIIQELEAVLKRPDETAQRSSKENPINTWIHDRHL